MEEEDLSLLYKQWLTKAMSFCSYTERSPMEVRTKLESWDVPSETIPKLLQSLENENFINQDRFVEAYVGGKFRIKKWGKLKIAAGLRTHQVPSMAIQQGLAQIPMTDYLETMRNHFEQKCKELKNTTTAQNRQKIYNYLYSKGFEPDLIYKLFQD